MKRTNTFWAAAAPTVLLVCVVGAVLAGQVTLPNTFTPGTTADANQVNANFTACKTAIDDNDARISTNTTAIAGLSGGGMAAAGVRVQVRFVTVPVVGTIPSVESSFNNLAATTPTVNRIGVGEYRVDFGGSTAGKMFMVTSGVGSGVTTGGANLLGLLYGTHIMSAIYDGAYANQVVVKAFDSAGAPVDTSFFLIVY